MRTKTILQRIIIIGFLVIPSFQGIYAQFNVLNSPDGNTSSPPIQTIGIGKFPLAGDVRAILHVNSFYTATPGFSPEIYFAPMALLQN